MKVYLLYENFFDRYGENITIGGIQTYLTGLAEVCIKIGLTPIIYQFSDIPFKIIYNDIQVYGIKVKKKLSIEKKSKILFNSITSLSENDIVIFCTDSMIVKTNHEKTIAIQHGIFWDVDSHRNYSRRKNILFVWYKAFRAFKIIRRLLLVNRLVCVDYNFINWYRSQVAYTDLNYKIITNYASPFDRYKIKPNGERIKIIFARRFQKFRGTELFKDAILEILDRFDHIDVTFAGNGPEEGYLKEVFKNHSNVYFIQYDSTKSTYIHFEHDIAVIPTLGSEGTSLSLLEAMASRCAVIGTNVGGITNILINGYNGIIIQPLKKDLVNALELLITNESERKKLAQNGFETVVQSFSKDRWIEEWSNLLKNLSGIN